jgi:hypothetical protein
MSDMCVYVLCVREAKTMDSSKMLARKTHDELHTSEEIKTS